LGEGNEKRYKKTHGSYNEVMKNGRTYQCLVGWLGYVAIKP